MFELQPVTQDPVVVHDKELLQACMILLGYLQKDATKNTAAAITEIKQVCIIILCTYVASYLCICNYVRIHTYAV